MADIGKLIIISGIILILFGILVIFSPKIPLWGKLPGDIFIQKNGFTFYFPLTTSILLSIIISLIFYFFKK